ncbi:hypothetical protein PINS_up024261 [Pythium insidiosum]|nr:hypothetical protein PINS_up024261 [Pythium insidiosum]
MSMGLDASDLVRLAPTRHVWRALLRGDRRLVGRTDMTIHQRTTFPLSRSTRLTLGGYMYDKQGLGMGCLTTKLEYTSSDPSVPSCSVYTELGWTPKLHLQFSQPVSPRTVVIWIPRARPARPRHVVRREPPAAAAAARRHDVEHARRALGVAQQRLADDAPQRRRRGQPRGPESVAADAPLVARRGRDDRQGVAARHAALGRLARARREPPAVVAHAPRDGRAARARPASRCASASRAARAQTAFSTFVAATTPFVGLGPRSRSSCAPRRSAAAAARPSVAASGAATTCRPRDAVRSRSSSSWRASQRSVVPPRTRGLTRGDGRGLVVLLARYGRNPTNPEPTPRRSEDRAVRRLGEAVDDDDAEEDEAEQQARDARRRVAVNSDDDDGEDEQWLDVTVPLQFLVQDSTLTLPAATSKASLLGFYNPCVVMTESETGRRAAARRERSATATVCAVCVRWRGL